MENENLSTPVAENATEKKVSAVKKTTGKKTAPAVKAQVVEKEAPKETAKAKKQYDLHDLVPVRNMTAGALIYKSNRNLGYLVEWAEYGNEQPIEVLELKNMLASQRSFFERNWIWIDDPVLVEELGIGKYYKHMLSPEQVDALFEEDPVNMIQQIENLHVDMQNTIRVVAKEKIANNEITSYTVIQALQKYFGESLTEGE